MNISKRRISSFRKKIFIWWKIHRRDLPWRKTLDPYKIFISEVMLQQTQVSRVLPKYEEFLNNFPDVQTLASASLASVLKAWKGMGYNRRALYLHRSAKEIVGTYDGKFPDDEKMLRKLPGLGVYTARAILVFSFRKNIAMVDTNIRQIIVHFFFYGVPQKELLIQHVADVLVPKGKSWEWHQALMDYGAAENSKPKGQRSKPNRISKAFRDSDRFYRGKILDVLRERSISKNQLIQMFEKEYTKSSLELDVIIAQLQKEQLVSLRDNIISLPDA